MNSFALVAPRAIHVGGGTVATVAAVLETFGLSRPLIVTDPVMVSTGLLKRCTDPLDAAGVAYAVFSDTIPEPEDTIIEAGVKRLASGGHDCLLAFGGGSPIDTAKAMAILAQRPGAKMAEFKVPVQNDTPVLPVIAIPTTAGTGSECTRFTVITDTERGEKMLIAGLAALPWAAIVDYELTYTVPPRTTADTGRGQLHARPGSLRVQARQPRLRLAGSGRDHVNRPPHPHGLRRAAKRRGARGHDDRRDPGRHGVLQQLGRLGARHVTTDRRPVHVPHGLSNAMLLPAVTRFGLDTSLARYAMASRAAGFAPHSANEEWAGEALCDGLIALNRDLGVPSPQAYGIAWNDWEAAMDTMADQALASGSPANNPRVPDKARSWRSTGRSTPAATPDRLLRRRGSLAHAGRPGLAGGAPRRVRPVVVLRMPGGLAAWPAAGTGVSLTKAAPGLGVVEAARIGGAALRAGFRR